jgi:hypothetical protein
MAPVKTHQVHRRQRSTPVGREGAYERPTARVADQVDSIDSLMEVQNAPEALIPAPASAPTRGEGKLGASDFHQRKVPFRKKSEQRFAIRGEVIADHQNSPCWIGHKVLPSLRRGIGTMADRSNLSEAANDYSKICWRCPDLWPKFQIYRVHLPSSVLTDRVLTRP